MRSRYGRLGLALCTWWATSTSCTCGAEPIDAVTIALRADPDALTFGALPVGARAARTLTLTNVGTAPYAPTVAPHTTDPAFSIATACPLPLNPNDACEMHIELAPLTEGAQQGALVFPLEDGDLEVPLSGEGTPAQILLSPAHIEFGDVAAGTGADDVIVVENRGDADLDVPLTLVGEGFLIGGARSVVVTVEAGGTAEAAVRFAPARGGTFSGTVTAEVCGAGCGPVVTLAGAGLAPRIEVAPRTIELGEVAVGTDATGALVVSNVGAGTLVVSSATLTTPTSDLTLDSSALPASLAEGEEVTVTVRFAPGTPRAALDALVALRSTDPVSPQVSIPVTGTAPGPALEILPAAIHFGALDAGDSRSAGVVVRAVGTVAVELVALETSAAAFTIPFPPPLGTLEPGDALLFDVVAYASAGVVAAGGATGTLTATGSGGVSATAALQFLSGTSGCQPRAPDGNEDLGAVGVGQGLTGSITITNVGDATCELESAAPAPGLVFDDGFSFSTVRATSIAPGGFGALDVGFTASDAGPRGAFFAVTYAGAPAPLLVSATARGVLGDLHGEPSLLSFGPVVTGCPAAPRTATFSNRGAAFLNLASLTLADSSAPFSFAAPSLPMPLGPGASVPVLVTPDVVMQTGTFETSLDALSADGAPASVRLRLEVTAEGEAITEEFIVGEVSAVDVLFVVDDSGSMGDDQQILADNFSRFIQTAFAEDANVDFHLGVTTTDVLTGAGGALVAPYLSRSSPDVSNAFQTMALVGTAGSGFELGLEAVRRALELHSQGADGGFLRTQAALSVVIVTDEEDSGDVAAGVDPSVSRPPESYVEALLAAKGGNVENTPILFSLVGVPGLMPRYELVANAYSGVVLDISSPTWGDDLSVIGAATFGLQRRFGVSGDPSEGTVTVEVDGVPTTAFTVNGRSVVLDDAPPAGSVVTITYQSGCA